MDMLKWLKRSKSSEIEEEVTEPPAKSSRSEAASSSGDVSVPVLPIVVPLPPSSNDLTDLGETKPS